MKRFLITNTQFLAVTFMFYNKLERFQKKNEFAQIIMDLNGP